MRATTKVLSIAIFGIALSGCLSNSKTSTPSSSMPSSGSPSSPSSPSTSSAPSGGTPGGGTASTPSGTISTDFPSMPSLPSGGTQTAKSGTASGQKPGSQKTGSGGVGDLDKTLDESLDTFEDTIASQKGDDDADVYDSYPSPTSGSGGEAPLFEELEDADWEASAEQETADASGGASQGAPDMAGAGQNAPSGSVPDDIDDGSDDDIVARQLREAAMTETDPALREKLWEEYRRYKNK